MRAHSARIARWILEMLEHIPQRDEIELRIRVSSLLEGAAVHERRRLHEMVNAVAGDLDAVRIVSALDRRLQEETGRAANIEKVRATIS